MRTSALDFIYSYIISRAIHPKLLSKATNVLLLVIHHLLLVISLRSIIYRYIKLLKGSHVERDTGFEPAPSAWKAEMLAADTNPAEWHFLYFVENTKQS